MLNRRAKQSFCTPWLVRSLVRFGIRCSCQASIEGAVAAHFSEAGFQGDQKALTVSHSRLLMVEHPLTSEITSYIARSSIPLSGRFSPPIP